MERIVFEDIHELSGKMLHDALNFSDCVSAVCHYEIATALLSELIQSEISIGQINISDYAWNGYDKEYVITIMDGNVYCNPAFGTHDEYLESYADIAYIHQECNSKFLKYLECDKVYEFAVGELDDIDDFDDEIVTHHSDSVTVSRDRYGTSTGFTKSWSRDNGEGVMQYSSYSCYCSNENVLRSMARELDIEL